MSNAVRRRLTAGGGLLASALVAGLLVTAGGASAAVTATPSSAFNSDDVRITFATDGDVPTGTTVRFDGPGANDTFTSRVDLSPPTGAGQFRAPQVMVDLADPTYVQEQGGQPNATSDGPADTGAYTVTFQTTPAQSCSGCFTVQTPAPPTATSLSPSGLQRGTGTSATSQVVTFTGSAFARSTRVEVLGADGKPDPEVTVEQEGTATTTSLPRRLRVTSAAALGARDVRLTNTDSKSSVCDDCFTVLGAPFAGVSPQAETNTPTDDARTLVFTAAAGAPFPTDARPALEYDSPATGSSTRQGLRLTPTSTSRSEDGTRLSGVFDLRAAAPGQNAYLPTVTSASNGVSTSGVRFTINQPSAPTVTGAAPARQQAGRTETVTVSGTGFAKGAVVTLTGGTPVAPTTPITATTVELVSSTTLRAQFAVPADAAPGPRDVVVRNTDGASGAREGGYTVDAASPATPTPTATSSPTATPSRSATPTASARPSGSATPTVGATTSPTPSGAAPRLSLPRTTITSQEAATVEATGEPGSIAELWAYSRPSTDYVRVRRTVLGQSGRTAFSVMPSGNTRMFLRTSDARGGERADSPSVVLTVRTSINVKVARTGLRTYRFTGSTLPKRVGQTVNVRYRRGSGTVVASKARVAANGTYSVTRRFSGTGTFTFLTDTGVDINNAAGTSGAVRVAVR